jgi:hypothetical protein
MEKGPITMTDLSRVSLAKIANTIDWYFEETACHETAREAAEALCNLPDANREFRDAVIGLNAAGLTEIVDEIRRRFPAETDAIAALQRLKDCLELPVPEDVGSCDEGRRSRLGA